MRLNYFFYVIVVLLLSLSGIVIYYSLPGDNVVFYVTEGLVLLSLILLITFYSRVVRPMHTIVNGLDLLRGQDFSNRLRKVKQYEVDRIIDVFNRMMEQLKNERLRVRETNQFLDLLLDASPLGVLSLSLDGKVTLANPAMRRMLGMDPEGKTLVEISHPLAATLVALRNEESLTLRLNSAEVYRCQRLSFMDNGFPHPFYIVEVVTSEIRSAEKAAYEKAIRMIVHEVNNTMGGVEATLNALCCTFGESTPEGEVIGTCLTRTGQLGQFISRFAAAAKIPAPQLAEGDLRELIATNSLFLESLCAPRGVRFSIRNDGEGNFDARFDAALMTQVLVNIVKNSVESIISTGRTDGFVEVTTDAKKRTIVVTDNGAGISEEVSRQLFTPFFSTKPGGQGIGTIFISDILKNHRFRFSLSTSAADGLTRFEIIAGK